jgi:hypothetical protein
VSYHFREGISMTTQTIVDLLSYAELAGCALGLVVMKQNRILTQFRPVAVLLATRILVLVTLIPITAMAGKQIPSILAYKIYFYGYWCSYAVEAVLGFLIIFGLYNLAMAPLPGLRRLGILMFRWAAAIAVALAFTMAVGPHLTSTNFLIRVVTQLQETQSVLTLCMLLFVCLAIRPMGLSHQSKIFGVSLGLGVLAATQLASTAWLAHFSNLYSAFNIVDGVAICLTLAIWTGYFAMPEPKRRMIILPTTSPFLRWNQISLALGDEPGFVAVGEVSPEMFAPAEVEVMRRASIKMRHQVAAELLAVNQ